MQPSPKLENEAQLKRVKQGSGGQVNYVKVGSITFKLKGGE